MFHVFHWSYRQGRGSAVYFEFHLFCKVSATSVNINKVLKDLVLAREQNVLGGCSET